jgi:hypothetical protein
VSSKPSAVIVDLDGTLALMGERNPFSSVGVGKDLANAPVVEVVAALHERGHRIILVSGRNEAARKETEQWLTWHLELPIEALHMRGLNDSRQDAVIKQEIYRHKIEPRFEVLCVLDDRNQTVRMWRRLGLTCLQVAPGNF